MVFCSEMAVTVGVTWDWEVYRADNFMTTLLCLTLGSVHYEKLTTDTLSSYFSGPSPTQTWYGKHSCFWYRGKVIWLSSSFSHSSSLIPHFPPQDRFRVRATQRGRDGGCEVWKEVQQPLYTNEVPGSHYKPLLTDVAGGQERCVCVCVCQKMHWWAVRQKVKLRYCSYSQVLRPDHCLP